METSGSCPKIATSFWSAYFSTAVAIRSNDPPARASASVTSTFPQAAAAMSAV